MKIKRHIWPVRLVHWTVALSIFVLFFTGFGQMPIYKRYFVDTLPGLGWSSDFIVTLHLHYYAAMVLVLVSTYYVLHMVLNKRWDILPRRGDLKESMQIMAAIVGIGEEPQSDKFLAEQRVAFAVTAVSILGLIITGMFKVYKNLPGTFLEPDTVFWLAQIHNLFTVVLLFSVIAHLGAFLIKENRHLVPSMFTGYIDAEYVRRRHGKWWSKLNPELAAADNELNTEVSIEVFPIKQTVQS